MATFPDDAAERLAHYLATHHLPTGLGTKEEACSIAAINLALTGKLTDEIPECMSLVIGQWIVRIQDAMPDEMRNSIAWKALLPAAAGTGRDREADRLQIIMSWMWDDVLPQLLPFAVAHGFGAEWETMLIEKSAVAAASAAAAAASYAAVASAASAYAVAAAASAAVAASASAASASAAYAYAYAAAYAASAASAAASGSEFWVHVDPVTVLHKLIQA